MDKCFCHLNGLAVKDATARKNIADMKLKVDSNTEMIGEMNKKTGKILFKSETGIPGGNVADKNLFCLDIDKYSLVLVDGVLCSVVKGSFYDYTSNPDHTIERIGYMIRGYQSSGIREDIPDIDLRGSARTQSTISINIEDHDGDFWIISNESHEATCTYEDLPEEIYRPEIFEIIGLV